MRVYEAVLLPLLPQFKCTKREEERGTERKRERERDGGKWGGVRVYRGVGGSGSPQWNRGDSIIDTFYISIPFQPGLLGYRVSGQIEMTDCIANLSRLRTRWDS